jgi:hypothetical protein
MPLSELAEYAGVFLAARLRLAAPFFRIWNFAAAAVGSSVSVRTSRRQPGI